MPFGLQLAEVLGRRVDVGDRVEVREVQADVDVGAIDAGAGPAGIWLQRTNRAAYLRRVAEDRLLGQRADQVLDLDLPEVDAETSTTAIGSNTKPSVNVFDFSGLQRVDRLAEAGRAAVRCSTCWPQTAPADAPGTATPPGHSSGSS